MADRARKVLVTGGASGFGLAIAEELIGAGMQVAAADISVDAIAGRTDLVPIRADVRSPADVQQMVAQTVARFGGLDTLVVCAGVIHIKPLAEVSEDDWDRTLDVNLKGAFLSCQAAAPALSDSGRGRIVTIGSDCSKRGSALQAAYCASKFGLVGLTEAVAAELAANAVTVNCVCPVGVPTTAMGQAVLDWKVNHRHADAEQVLTEVAQSIPLGRNATERDVVAAVRFFLSDDASFITGTALDVDGGSHLAAIPGSSEGE
jgi:meso-butanediol dehydrogenase/(S,S)-butanediol dehydrogenase/diacetyl reductase